MIFILSLSIFLNIIIGPAFQNLDVYSENFSEELMNIPEDRESCKHYFDNEFNKMVLQCKTVSKQCMDKLRIIKKIAEVCFQNEKPGENQGRRIFV